MKSFWKNVIPAVTGLLLTSVYIIVDGFFVAWGIGADALAAVTLAVPVVEILIALAMLLSVGSGAKIAYALGRGDGEDARKMFTAAVKLTLLVALAITTLGLVFRVPFAHALGGAANAEVMTGLLDYLLYLLASSPFLLLSYSMATWLRNDGQPKLAMIALAVGSLSNVLLDYILIFPMGMGVAGAALATGLGPVFSVLIMAGHFLRKKGDLYLIREKLTGSRVFEIIRNGLPAFFSEYALGIITFFHNKAILPRMADIGVAAYGVIGYVALIVLTIFLGTAQGLQPLFGQAAGRGDAARTKELLRQGTLFCTIAGFACFGLILLFARPVASIFAQGALLDFTEIPLRLYSISFLFAGANIFLIGALQGMTRYMPSGLLAILRATVFTPAALWLLPSFLGDIGIWLAMTAAELLTLAVLSGYFLAAKSEKTVLSSAHS